MSSTATTLIEPSSNLINNKTENENESNTGIISNNVIELNSDNEEANSNDETKTVLTIPSKYQYQNTGLTVHLKKIKLQTENPDPDTMYDYETLYHYCNLIMDSYIQESSLVVGLFKNKNEFGPRNKRIDIYLHPFLFNKEWHLAMGFVNYEKILLLHCSDYEFSQGDDENNKPTFNTKTVRVLNDFINFFKHKISRHALQYPRLYTHNFQPASPYNAINLLTVIFAFCSNPEEITKNFCDPTIEPRIFELEDSFSALETIDTDFRESLALKFQKEFESKIEKRKQLHREREEKLQKEAEEKIRLLLKQQQIKEQKIKDDLKLKNLKIQEEEAKRKQLALEEKIKWEQELKQKKIMAKLEWNLKEKQQTAISNQEHEHENKLNLSGKKTSDHHISIDLVTEEQVLTNPITDAIPGIRSAKRKALDELATITNKHQKQKTEVNDINDLEDSDDYDEDEDYNDYYDILSPNLQKNERNNKKINEDLNKIFDKKYSTVFNNYIRGSKLFSANNRINKIYEFIQLASSNEYINYKISDEHDKVSKRTKLHLTESLFVKYKKPKQVFDEKKCYKILQDTDSTNIVFPLIFERGSIFLINIKTNDKYNVLVNLVCISERPNRSEREIMKNYAFRKLLEIYIDIKKRWINKIRLSIIYPTDPIAYNVTMASVFALHKFLWGNKFDLSFDPTAELQKKYNFFFKKLMDSLQNDKNDKGKMFKKLIDNFGPK